MHPEIESHMKYAEKGYLYIGAKGHNTIIFGICHRENA